VARLCIATMELLDLNYDQVWKVVTTMVRDNAPSLGGFSMAFFQASWDVLSVDNMKVFSDFHARGKFEKSLNALFILLSSKILGAIDLKDLCPISLVGGIYKIIAMILANRLRMVMEKIIFKSQSAFIRGGQIFYPVLIANECLDSRLRFGQPGIICKMDLEKAYDHMN
jgi:hypothetical protein